jgi:serine/threonine protein kinase
MIAGKKYDPLKIDIWSSGIILYVMLSGTFPFSDTSVAGLYKKILKNDYITPKFFTPEESDLISKILDSNPTTRLDLTEIKSHPWMLRHKPSDLEEHIKKTQTIYLNKIVLDSLEFKYDIKPELIKKTFTGCKFNSLRAYYCLEERRLKGLTEAAFLKEIGVLERIGRDKRAGIDVGVG